MADASGQELVQKEAFKKNNEKATTPVGKKAAQRARELRAAEGADAFLRRTAKEQGVSPRRLAEFQLQMDAGRRAGVRDNVDRHNQLLQEGYDVLADPDKDAQRAALKTALDGSRMGEVFRGITDPGAERRVTEDLLRDHEFMDIYQTQMDNIINARPVFTPEDITARANFLMADRPGTYADMAAAEAAARTEILEDWRRNQAEGLDNLMATSVDAYMVKNLERARQASGEATSLVVRDQIDAHQKGWHDSSKEHWYSKETAGQKKVKADFSEFMQNGGEGIVGKEAWARMSQDERAEFNKNFGEKMFTERLLAGRLSQEDMRGLATADWLGDSFPDRVDKIRDMFDANGEFKRLMAEGQANGTIDKNMWDKIKAAGPGALAGSLLALLAMIALPAVPLVGGLVAGGGALTGGLGKMAIDEARAA